MHFTDREMNSGNQDAMIVPQTVLAFLFFCNNMGMIDSCMYAFAKLSQNNFKLSIFS